MQAQPLTTFCQETFCSNWYFRKWLIILVCDLIVAWGLCHWQPLHKKLALLSAFLRLIYTSILGIAIMNLIFIFILTNESEGLKTILNQEQLQAYVIFLLKAFDSIWAFGLIIFGGHLFVIGYLSFKKIRFLIISILLVIASIGYMLIHFCKVFLQI